MDEHSTKADGRTAAVGVKLFAGQAWFDPIEAGIRQRMRGFIQELLEQELTAALGGRGRSVRSTGELLGYWNNTCERELLNEIVWVARVPPSHPQG